MMSIRSISSSLLLLLLVVITPSVSAAKYLYRDNDANSKGYVIDYEPRAKNNFEKNSMKPRIVEFYSPHCGYCINYAPNYIAKAKEMKKLHPSIEFHAVSCEPHIDICRKYGATQTMPTILAFPPNEEKQGIVLKQNGLTEKMLVKSLGLQVPPGYILSGKNTKYDTAGGEQQPQYSRALRMEEEGRGGGGGIPPGMPPPQGLKQKLNKLQKKNFAEDEDDEDDSDNIIVKDLPPGFEQQKKRKKKRREVIEDEEDENDGGYQAKQRLRPKDLPMLGGGEGGGLPMKKKRKKKRKVVDDNNMMTADNNISAPDAGAKKARKQPKDMDRFKEFLKEKVQKKKDRINANPFNRQKEEILKRVDKEFPIQDAPTKRMKENTPGTPEYEEKQKLKKEKVEKMLKKTGGRIKADPVMEAKLKAGEISKEDYFNHVKEKKKQLYTGPRAGGGAGGIGGANGLGELGTSRARPGEPMIGKGGWPGSGGAVGGGGESGRPGGRSNRGPIKKFLPDQKFWQKAPLLKRLHKMTPEEELILDASMSFMNSLQQGPLTQISVGQALPTSKKTALVNWFELLSVSLPPEWALHETIDDLLDNIDNIAASDVVFKNMLNKHQLTRTEWSPSCAKRATSGFSCGFWKLLHLVTVGIAEHKGGLNLIKAGINPEDSPVFSPLDAADTIYTYIKYYYPCEACKKQFVATYDQCENNRRCDRLKEDEEHATDADWQELAKWLWEVHNDVSVRVLSESTAKKNKGWEFVKDKFPQADVSQFMEPQPQDIKVLFPSLEDCVACYKDDGTWDDDAVFLFLEKTYWIGFDSDGKTDHLLRFDDGLDIEYSEFGLSWILVFIFVAIASAVLKSPQKAVLMRKNAGAKRSD